MAPAAPTTAAPSAVSPSKELPPCTWKSFFVVGFLFPWHIVLGVLLVPIILYYAVCGATNAVWYVLAAYMPFYLWPAQTRVPGWKGAEWMWHYFDYDATCKSYFGEWAVHGTEHIDKAQQYFVGCHPHGTITINRCFWRSESLSRHFGAGHRMLGASVIFRLPVIRECSLFFGAVDAARANCERWLRAGRSLVPRHLLALRASFLLCIAGFGVCRWCTRAAWTRPTRSTAPTRRAWPLASAAASYLDTASHGGGLPASGRRGRCGCARGRASSASPSSTACPCCPCSSSASEPPTHPMPSSCAPGIAACHSDHRVTARARRARRGGARLAAARAARPLVPRAAAHEHQRLHRPMGTAATPPNPRAPRTGPTRRAPC